MSGAGAARGPSAPPSKKMKTSGRSIQGVSLHRLLAIVFATAPNKTVHWCAAPVKGRQKVGPGILPRSHLRPHDDSQAYKCVTCQQQGTEQNGTIKCGLETLVEFHGRELPAEFADVLKLATDPENQSLQVLAQLLLWFQMATPGWLQRIEIFNANITKGHQSDLEEVVVRSLTSSMPTDRDLGMGHEHVKRYLVDIEFWAERMSLGLLPKEVYERQKQSHKATMRVLKKSWLAAVDEATMNAFKLAAPDAHKALFEDAAIEDATAAGSA